MLFGWPCIWLLLGRRLLLLGFELVLLLFFLHSQRCVAHFDLLPFNEDLFEGLVLAEVNGIRITVILELFLGSLPFLLFDCFFVLLNDLRVLDSITVFE